MRCVAGSDLPRRRLAGRGHVRLIPHMHHKPPVLAPLADSPAELEALARIEGLTNHRLMAEAGALPGLDRRELAFRARASQMAGYGTTIVNAAFAHTRPGGNRFNTGQRGAWYCATEVLTALHEVAFHRARELAATGWWQDAVIYKAYHCDLSGDFPDLTGSTHPALHPDPAIGYPAGQALAAALFLAGETGLIYPSARAPGGTCAVVFVPQAIQNVTPGAEWRLSWSGGPDYTIAEADADPCPA